MSFREKSAWISLVSVFLVFTFYFLHVPWSLTPPADPPMFHVLLLSIATLIGIEIAAHVVLALRSPKEARTPKDERERLIDIKAVRIAYYVFVLGVSASVFSTHYGANQFALGYGILLAFVIAQLTSYAARIYYYRRGV
jgi:hypothetical protein